MLFRCCWLALLLLSGPCLAQTPVDTVARQLDEQLRQLQVSPLTRLVQVREALAQDLKLDRSARLPGLLRYLLTQLPLPDSVECLRPYEQWALQTATGDFAAALRTVAQPQPPNYYRWYLPPALPPTDLFDLTTAYVARHADSLARAARAARLPAEDSAFTQLNIALLANGRRAISADLNEQLRAFLRRYPKSAYAYVARHFVRYELVPSPFTLSLTAGLGPAFFGGEMGRVFGPEGIYCLGAEASWQRWVLTANLHVGSTYAHVPYQFGSIIWPTDLYLNYQMVEVAAGYRVLDTRRLRAAPFVGLSTFSFSPETKYQQVAPALDHTLRFHPAPTIGFSADLKFGLTPHTPPAQLNDAAGLVQLRAGWRPLAATAVPFTSGSLFYAEIGIGLFFRGPGHYRR